MSKKISIKTMGIISLASAVAGGVLTGKAFAYGLDELEKDTPGLLYFLSDALNRTKKRKMGES